jgi:putative cell wall-binding protein
MRKVTSLLVCLVVVLAFAAPAVAQNATQDAYNGLAGAEQGGGGSGTVADTGGGGSLPFTGLQLALIVGAGVGLLGAGVAMRRASRFRESHS